MLPELGLVCIILSLSLSLVQIAIFATNLKNLHIMRQTTIGQTFFVCCAFLSLAYAFLNDDFSVNYIAKNSNASLPFYYKLTAIWGAHEGSLLLWILCLSIFALLLVLRTKRLPLKFSNTVFLIFAAINIGFIGILLYASNPFTRTLTNIPIDGQDLNPLLQDLGMILHPPILYLGYVGSTVGFAFACAALVTGKLDRVWAFRLKPYALATWMFLTLGIALGSWWAYYELGWGGWWFWDPVENASFMPWLSSTALLHCLVVCQKHGRLLWLAAFLAIITFILSLFGTFLVRSGFIMSVHAFASDPQRGMLFLMLLLFLSTTAAIVFVTRLYSMQARAMQTKPPNRLEKFMFVNCMLLLVGVGTILLGTMFPMLSEALYGEAIAVGYPYFNLVFTPIMLILLTLMLPLFWGKRLLLPVIGALLLAVLFLYLNFAVIKHGALLGVAVAMVVVLSSLQHKRLIMNMAHIGLAVMLVGISITPAYEIERDLRIKPGEIISIANFDVKFLSVNTIEGANFVGFEGAFEINNGKHTLATIHPQKRTYLFSNLTMTETAILPRLEQDIYIALGQKFADQTWAVRIYYKPYVRCIWLGAMIMALAAMLGIILGLKNRS